MAVTFTEQSCELLNYQSDVPSHRGCPHTLYRRLLPGMFGVIISSAVKVPVFLKWNTIRNEKLQHKNLGEISEMIERLYICQQGAECRVQCAQQCVWYCVA